MTYTNFTKSRLMRLEFWLPGITILGASKPEMNTTHIKRKEKKREGKNVITMLLGSLKQLHLVLSIKY